MKVQFARIPDEGLQLSFEMDASGFEQLLADPKREVRGAQGSLEAELDVQRVRETILVRGQARVSLVVDCVRCLAPQVLQVVATVDAVLVRAPESERNETEEVELHEEDLDISHYEGDEIDLDPLVREAILLEMPQYPTCGIEPRDDCESYQANIGARGNEMEEDASIDLRWDELRKLKKSIAKNGTN